MISSEYTVWKIWGFYWYAKSARFPDIDLYLCIYIHNRQIGITCIKILINISTVDPRLSGPQLSDGSDYPCMVCMPAPLSGVYSN